MPKYIALVLAYFFLALAIIGVVLPGLPTVPFLLLAAWFSARGSEKLHKWIYDHPHLGKLLIDWETQKAISRKSKIIAVIMLMVSWFFMYRKVHNTWLLISVTLILVSVGIFLATRNEPNKNI
ncbi:MAG: YbaN family protein [Candidatus Sericytochromatia bacterium]